MNAQFTPGPWSIDDGGVVAPKCGDDGNVVCLEPEHMMTASQEKWPANARLIAAAPDGLELAEDAVPILQALLEEREEVNGEEDEILRDLLARTRDFIAKARGAA